MLHKRCVYEMHFRGFKVRGNVVFNVYVSSYLQVCVYEHGMMYVCACRGQKLAPRVF